MNIHNTNVKELLAGFLMTNRILWVWLWAGISLVVTQLSAQDVTVTDPAWVDAESSAGSALPVFKRRPEPDYPQEFGQ